MLNIGVIIVILLIAVFLSGYWIGRRCGLSEGYDKGVTASILILREKTFEQGYCALCQGRDFAIVDSHCIADNCSTHNTQEE